MVIKDFVKLMRPHQWIKNFFVFGGLVFSGNLFVQDKIILSLIVFAVFCLTSSGVYVFNDFIDVEYDKKHPKKRTRPLASGKVKMWQGYILILFLFVFSIVFSYFINKLVWSIILLYIFINIFYSLWLKNEVILDLVVVSTGYVLRVLAGIFAINVGISPWILAVTFTLAIMITIAKRYSELVRNDEHKREVLKKYNLDFLKMMLVFSAGLTLTIYLLWCLENRLSVNAHLLAASFLFVFYGLMRYVYLTLMSDKAESPTMIFLKDKMMVLNVMLWGVYMVGVVYFQNFFY